MVVSVCALSLTWFCVCFQLSPDGHCTSAAVLCGAAFRRRHGPCTYVTHTTATIVAGDCCTYQQAWGVFTSQTGFWSLNSQSISPLNQKQKWSIQYGIDEVSVDFTGVFFSSRNVIPTFIKTLTYDLSTGA